MMAEIHQIPPRNYTCPGLAKPWVWIPPVGREELLKRLKDAFEFNVHERERENLCSMAYQEIKRLYAAGESKDK